MSRITDVAALPHITDEMVEPVIGRSRDRRLPNGEAVEIGTNFGGGGMLFGDVDGDITIGLETEVEPNRWTSWQLI